ncbi:hypothetical protein Glove_139g208 [Diversispora epigaea]|uniref:Uncharacterized protein n=1 Tax=Diversispora epigaea TaxID=1348612 RepID=A0A397J4T1_9GLOM|nr:hypothetical protein Glove_139g208 [Diversispora epigaea]
MMRRCRRLEEEIKTLWSSWKNSTDLLRKIIVAGYLQGEGAMGLWLSEIQEGQNPITYWSNKNQVLFEISLLVTFKTTALINQWRFELSIKIQKVNEIVEQYANNVKKLIRCINGENRWSENKKARPLILSQENPFLEAAIIIAKQFEENVQIYPEATVRYSATIYVNSQGFTPSCDQDRNRKDVIKRIVQKTLAPIVEKLLKITERDERPTHISYRRPNYNNDIREQNIWNCNNNANDLFCCFFCEQSRYMSNLLQRGYAQERVKKYPKDHDKKRKEKHLLHTLVPKRTKLAKIANHTKIEGNTPMICKTQVAELKVEVILNNGFFISIVSKSFMESLGRSVEKSSERRIISIYSEKRSSLEILTLRDEKEVISISCRNTNQVSPDSDDENDSESDEENNENSKDSDKETDYNEANFVGLLYNLPHIVSTLSEKRSVNKDDEVLQDQNYSAGVKNILKSVRTNVNRGAEIFEENQYKPLIAKIIGEFFNLAAIASLLNFTPILEFLEEGNRAHVDKWINQKVV